jgi:hypothetical protein
MLATTTKRLLHRVSRPLLTLIFKQQGPTLWPLSPSLASPKRGLTSLERRLQLSCGGSLKMQKQNTFSIMANTTSAGIFSRLERGIRLFTANMSSSGPPSSEDKGGIKMGVAASRTISVESSGDALSDISFRIVDQSRYPEIMNLLYENFHTDEPMSKTVGMIDEQNSRVPVLDDFTLYGLAQNLSIMAIDPKTDNLLGVSINVEAKKEDANATLEEILATYDNPKFKHILTVLYNVNVVAGDIFADMETDVFFDIKMVTTDKNQRRGGLATDLLRRSVELGRNLGFKAVKTEATGWKIYYYYTDGSIAIFFSLFLKGSTQERHSNVSDLR